MTLEKINLNGSEIEFIKFTSRELSAMCPVNERPDIYKIEINFSPKQYTLEVSSLRKYLLSFRNKKVFAEMLAVKICSNLYDCLSPHYLSVKLKNQPENGVEIEIFQHLGWDKKL